MVSGGWSTTSTNMPPTHHLFTSGFKVVSRYLVTMGFKLPIGEALIIDISYDW